MTDPDRIQHKHGGMRTGAGRKKGSNNYGESTQAIRIPESLIPKVQSMLEQRKQQKEMAAKLNATAQDVSSVNMDGLAKLLKPASSLREIKTPLYSGKVAAGFPSPADDYIEKTLDLNELLIKKPAATFFVRAEGESMLGAGIHPNDILVVDRSIKPVIGKIVICALNGELTVKRIKRINATHLILGAENPAYSDIEVKNETEMVIWGVVTNVIHAL